MKHSYTKEQILKDLENVLSIIESDNDNDSREMGEFEAGRIDGRDGVWYLVSQISEKLYNDINN